MQKNELLRKDDKTVRVLETDGENVFYIFCQGIESPMPEWGKVSDLNGYAPCEENELWDLYGIEPVPENELEPGDRTAARKRYSIIAPVLGCLEDVKARTHMIGNTAKENGITKQTVRNYLKIYLTYNSISALVPKHRTAKEKPMTDDEKISDMQ